MHNARYHKDTGEVFSPNHNDRNFDLDNAPHIDQTKTAENKYIFFQSVSDDYETIDEYEHIYYEDHFGEAIAKKNAKNIDNSQYDRCINADQYRKKKNSCPEETLIQIGSSKTQEKTQASKEVLEAVFADFAEWHDATYPQCVLLDVAFHYDEASYHCQLRQVWTYYDDEGIETVGQNEALAQMGVERPKMDKKKSRYNNAKMTYTADCREKLIEICESYGVEVIKEPKDISKTGLSKLEYQRQQEEERIEQAKAEREAMEDETRKIRHKNNEDREAAAADRREAERMKAEQERIIRDRTEQEIKRLLSPMLREVLEREKEAEEAKTEAEEVKREYMERRKVVDLRENQLNELIKNQQEHIENRAYELFIENKNRVNRVSAGVDMPIPTQTQSKFDRAFEK